MTVLALTSAAETAWWITLAFGLVVALVVWGLLEWLRRTVLAVEEAVSALWTMGKRVAQNTATTHTLLTTKVRAHELLEELEHHRALTAASAPAPGPEGDRP